MSFLDYAINADTSEEEHLAQLDTILNPFLLTGPRLELFKCRFGVRAAEILGYVADQAGLRPSDKHIESSRKLSEPGSGNELMHFLCLVNFFASFVDQFVEIAAPSYEIAKQPGLQRREDVCSDWSYRTGVSGGVSAEDSVAVIGKCLK